MAFQLLLGVWYLRGWVEEIRTHVQECETMKDDIEVIIDFMEDSLSYDHEEFKYQKDVDLKIAIYSLSDLGKTDFSQDFNEISEGLD